MRYFSRLVRSSSNAPYYDLKFYLHLPCCFDGDHNCGTTTQTWRTLETAKTGVERAIAEGETTELVSRDSIFQLLEQKS